MRTALRMIGLVAATGVVLLAGSSCADTGDQDAPRPHDGSEPTGEPAAKQPKASVPPPTVSPTEGESATRALVRQYIASENYARKTGNTDPLSKLTAADCASCQGAVEVIRDVYDQGGTYEGEYEQHVVELNGTGKVIYALVKDGDSRRVVPGQDTETFSGSQWLLTFTLEKGDDGKWMIGKIDSSGG